MVFATLTVFGIDEDWSIEWPADIDESYAAIVQCRNKFTIEASETWFKQVYQPQTLNGDLMRIEDVLKQALRFAKKAATSTQTVQSADQKE